MIINVLGPDCADKSRHSACSCFSLTNLNELNAFFLSLNAIHCFFALISLEKYEIFNPNGKDFFQLYLVRHEIFFSPKLW